MSAASQTAPAAAPKVKMTRKQRRFQREVTQLQERTKPILPQTTFRRIVSETANNFKHGLRFNSEAVQALQVAAEDHLTSVFNGAAVVASIAKRDTVAPEDIQNFLRLRSI